jgi:hypothetical protein
MNIGVVPILRKLIRGSYKHTSCNKQVNNYKNIIHVSITMIALQEGGITNNF